MITSLTSKGGAKKRVSYGESRKRRQGAGLWRWLIAGSIAFESYLCATKSLSAVSLVSINWPLPSLPSERCHSKLILFMDRLLENDEVRLKFHSFLSP